jgi:tripartite-type tricarboxylate transporter receptor subunit TctC
LRTPREIVDALHGAVRKVVAKYGDLIAANLAISGAEIKLMSPEEYGAYLKAQEALYTATIRNLNAGK